MKRPRLVARTAASLAIAAVCLWLAVASVSMADFTAALARFDPRWLIPAVATSLAIGLMRAWRWQLELRPLASLDYWPLWQVTAAAYMFINVLPFRLGEPLRPLLLSWRTGLAVPAIVSNWVFEKMMDAAAMVLFVHLTLVVTDLPAWAMRASLLSLLTFCLLAALVLGFWAGGERFVVPAAKSLLPVRWSERLLALLASARQGLAILPDRRLVGRVFALTMLLWSLPVLSSYILILGFGFDLPLSAAFVIFVAVGAASAIPNPPGMVGIFQIASVVALGLFGVPKAEALAYGMVLNALQLLTLVAQGLLAMPLMGIGLGQAARAAAAEG